MHPKSPTLQVRQDSRQPEILAAQTRLLFANAALGAGVTILAATILARLQMGVVPYSVAVGWWLYMVLVAVARYSLTRSFSHARPDPAGLNRWRAFFALGAGMAGLGWGGAAILLYTPAYLTNQVFLVFVIGGMMLGAASMLAPRPEAFLAFLIPTGLGPALRFVAQGDPTHQAMGLLCAVFTLAVIVTTWRIYRTVESSLQLHFENRDLVEDLQAAKNQTEALNQVLEIKVHERTAELQQSTEALRAEMMERQEMEDELLRARKLESLGVLAGGIAHDFNNFLTVVQGNLELAKDSLDPDDDVQSVLDQAAGACRRAAFLSSQLLTFAKGGAPVRRAVPVSRLIRDAVQLAPIEATVDVAADLPPAYVDAEQLAQVLHNILLNARQSMPRGGPIEVRAAQVAQFDTAYIRISIRDHGCGIPDAILPKIFDPYFTTKKEGSGLGLATAYAIVTKHGGRISAHSKPGEGTTFTIDLPVAHETAAPLRPVTLSPSGGTERILVMDDEAALRILIHAVLTKFGYTVETARDGVEAIALYENARAAGNGFHVVLLDLTVVGGMGGVETAARLRQLDPASKLVVSSGYSDAAVMSDFARYGFDAVIPKPWTAAQLSAVLRSLLQ